MNEDQAGQEAREASVQLQEAFDSESGHGQDETMARTRDKKMPEHKPVWMSLRRIKCCCGWSFALAEEDGWGTHAGQDKMLDEFNLHFKNMQSPN